jgi:LmbE family N-acetylglucosaminyl deacetylase
MPPIKFTLPGSIRKVLCLGAHSDDIEIGCGGSILRWSKEHPQLEFHWVIFSGEDQRQAEAISSANYFLQGFGKKEIVTYSFRDGFFPYMGGEIKDQFEKLKGKFQPDLILTHASKDAHQDHRLIAELTWNTFRSHIILEYEIQKYDGDLGSPNLFVGLDQSTCHRKTSAILEHFPSQRSHQWFTEDAFMALLRLRGIESNSNDGFAEAFTIRKMTL